MVPVSFALLMMLGIAVHRLVFRRLTRTSASLDIFEARGLMVSFGLMFLVQNFAQLAWGADLRGYDFLSEPVAIGGAQFAANKLLLLALALAFSAALIVVLRTTLLGKGVRALMQSPTGAQLVGIDTERLHPLMFGVGLGLSGVAGCLLSMTYTISPSMGEPYTVTALIVITLGGFGSMSGALVGGLALGVDRGGGHALHEPVAEVAAVLRHLHRRAAVAAQRTVRATMSTAVFSASAPGAGPPQARREPPRGADAVNRGRGPS